MDAPPLPGNLDLASEQRASSARLRDVLRTSQVGAERLRVQALGYVEGWDASGGRSDTARRADQRARETLRGAIMSAELLAEGEGEGGAQRAGRPRVPCLDILRDVVEAAAEDLRISPPPGVLIHKPYELRPLTCETWEADLDELVDLTYGLMRYDPRGVVQLQGALGRILASKQAAAGRAASSYNLSDDMEVGFFEFERALRSYASETGARLEEHTLRLSCLLRTLSTLSARLTQGLNSMTKSKYQTFGRFFTGPDNLRALAMRLRDIGRLDAARDVFVDFSCGTNEFGALLGLQRWVGFDVYLPRANAGGDHFRLRNWFDVTWLPPNAVIGLNPPYGSRGEVAERFIEHALSFHPRLLALIVPESSVRSLVKLSNDWLEAVNADVVRGLLPLATGAPAQGAARYPALERSHPSRPPDYLLIDYDAHETSGNAFYMPGTAVSGMRGGLHAEAAAAAAPASSGVTMDLSGDWTFDTKPLPGRGGTAASQGVPIAPADVPAWYLFAATRTIDSPSRVCKGPAPRGRVSG